MSKLRENFPHRVLGPTLKEVFIEGRKRDMKWEPVNGNEKRQQLQKRVILAGMFKEPQHQCHFKKQKVTSWNQGHYHDANKELRQHYEAVENKVTENEQSLLGQNWCAQKNFQYRTGTNTVPHHQGSIMNIPNR